MRQNVIFDLCLQNDTGVQRFAEIHWQGAELQNFITLVSKL